MPVNHGLPTIMEYPVLLPRAPSEVFNVGQQSPAGGETVGKAKGGNTGCAHLLATVAFKKNWERDQR